MISRKTAMAIANVYVRRFTKNAQGVSYRNDIVVLANEFYDFLYQNDFEAWFCNAIKSIHYERSLKDYLLQIHTGESFVPAAREWTNDQRKTLGQQYLKYLAISFLDWYESLEEYSRRLHTYGQQALVRNLELDGYKYVSGKLLEMEVEILNVNQEKGILHDLYGKMGLGGYDIAFQCLGLSDIHYVEGRWADSIANIRKFLELTLFEAALKHAQATNRTFDEKARDYPVKVREYLETEKLLEKKEKEALDKVYGLLSHTGSHPYMAESDQARLLRQLTLVLTQFVMLRIEGAIPET